MSNFLGGPLPSKDYATSFRFKSVALYKVGNDYGKPYVNLHDGQNDEHRFWFHFRCL